MFGTIVVNVTDTRFIPGKVIATKSNKSDLQPAFAEYVAYRLRNDIIAYIKDQRYARKGKWVPLKFEYVEYKKRKNLSTNTWEATSQLVNSIKVTKKGDKFHVGISPSKTYKGSSLKVIQVARWMEYGTTKMPARPLFRPIIRLYRRHIRKYWEDFNSECINPRTGKVIKSKLRPKAKYE